MRRYNVLLFCFALDPYSAYLDVIPAAYCFHFNLFLLLSLVSLFSFGFTEFFCTFLSFWFAVFFVSSPPLTLTLSLSLSCISSMNFRSSRHCSVLRCSEPDQYTEHLSRPMYIKPRLSLFPKTSKNPHQHTPHLTPHKKKHSPAPYIHTIHKNPPQTHPSITMFKPSLLLLTLTLTTTTLALVLPTAESDSEGGSLEKRNAKGWISSYDVPDTTCKTQVGGHRPRWDRYCLDFTPTTARIGGSWGAGKGWEQFSFTAYTEKGCEGDPVFNQTRNGHEAGFCQVLGEEVNWGEWRCMQSWLLVIMRSMVGGVYLVPFFVLLSVLCSLPCERARKGRCINDRERELMRWNMLVMFSLP